MTIRRTLTATDAGQAGKSKYGNKKTVVDGIVFDSRAEAARYVALKALEKAGEVKDIRTQVKFPLSAGGFHICDYVADFVYMERQDNGLWLDVIEDVKGVRTPVFNLKARLFFAHRMRQIRCIDSKGKVTLVPHIPKPKTQPKPRTRKETR